MRRIIVKLSKDDIFSKDIRLLTKAEKDDKIIILQMRGRKWAFKAGKYNDEVKG